MPLRVEFHAWIICLIAQILQRLHQPLIPSLREQVHAVEVLQGFRHGAALQSDGDDEDLTGRQSVRLTERDLQFLMAEPAFLVEPARETDDDRVAVEDRRADLTLPILPGLQVFRVEPGLDPMLLQALMQFVNSVPVAMRVTQEYPDRRFRFRHVVVPCKWQVKGSYLVL